MSTKGVQGLWFGQSPLQKVARAALLPASWMYGAGWATYAALYGCGVKRARAPHRPIVCVGNFTVGGSGKTPLTLHLANLLQEMGREVVVSTSGYGGPRSARAALAPGGSFKAGEWGDEPTVFREELPDVPLIVGRDRVLAAQLCHRMYPNAVMLMDDGLQHLRLRPHVRLALDDPQAPNRALLPAGPYREPARQSRAELILPGSFELEERFDGLRCADGSGRELGGPAYVVCALGRPDRFLKVLEHNGIPVSGSLTLPDHDPFEVRTLERLPAGPLLTTLKDWVKIRERALLDPGRVWIARHSIRIEPAGAFRQWFHEQLEIASAAPLV